MSYFPQAQNLWLQPWPVTNNMCHGWKKKEVREKILLIRIWFVTQSLCLR